MENNKSNVDEKTKTSEIGSSKTSDEQSKKDKKIEESGEKVNLEEGQKDLSKEPSEDLSEVDILKKQIEDMEKQIDSHQKERDDIHEKYYLAMADIDNQRKRMRKEKEDWRKYSHESLIKDLLVVADNFSMALNQSVKDDSPEYESFREGVEMNFKIITDVFKKHGVTEINALHTKFDPRYHAAISQIDTDEYEDQTVMEVLQKGFMIHERLLRPSMVKVASNTGTDEVEVEKKEDQETQKEQSSKKKSSSEKD